MLFFLFSVRPLHARLGVINIEVQIFVLYDFQCIQLSFKCKDVVFYFVCLYFVIWVYEYLVFIFLEIREAVDGRTIPAH